jgi:serine/threonine protein kinase, bacterial
MVSGTEPGSRVESRFGPYRLLRLIGRGGMDKAGKRVFVADNGNNRVIELSAG